jgi:hypothetical protein
VRQGAARPDVSALPSLEYAYLLGLYLGDGCISAMPRTWRLRIVLDQRYPDVIEEAARAVAAVSGGRAGRTRRTGCVELGGYWRHWPLVFPQHGSGRKHERQIALLDWQASITRRHPRALIRGLMHSDGCRYLAVVTRRGKPYRYVRYSFSNRSDDIKRILCEHLDLLGIRWSRPNAWQIAIARQDEVAKLDAFVGPKT